jgi:carbonic anhydrase
VTATDDLLQNARAHASAFDAAGLAAPPARGVAVVACMDARLIPSQVLGLEPGDAHVIRNAGGIVTDDTIRSLAISQRKLGTTEIVLIHHTRCGMLGLDDAAFRRELTSESGVDPAWDAGGFDDLEGSVRESIARIKASPFIPHTDDVRGFVYDVETGELREVR